MAHEHPVATVSSHSAVDSIISALSQLETEIDGMNARVDEMKKRLMARSNEQVDKLRQQVIAVANEEAKRIVDSARAEAEAESSQIMKDAEKNLATIKKNIDASFDRAVDSIVRTVLGQDAAATTSGAPKAEAGSGSNKGREKASATTAAAAPKIKKYTSDGKPVA